MEHHSAHGIQAVTNGKIDNNNALVSAAKELMFLCVSIALQFFIARLPDNPHAAAT